MLQNNNIPPQLQRVLKVDQKLRQDIAELYMALNQLQDPQKSITLLAEHVTMMVEMINEFKKG